MPVVQIVDPKVEVIQVRPERLTKEELIRQLAEYGCPKEIIEKLQEWVLDCFFDNTKLGRWISGAQ